MKSLRERIVSDGNVLSSNILKVDSFLNHQMDPELLFEIAKEFEKRFKGTGIKKIVTIEASGIAIAIMIGFVLKVPVVFAKKKKPSTMIDFYSSSVFSFTKNTNYDICISKEFLGPEDEVLVVDDFLATGSAINGVMDLISQAQAKLIGIGIVIEKGSQNGGKILRNKGIRLESLAIVKIENNDIKFLNDD